MIWKFMINIVFNWYNNFAKNIKPKKKKFVIEWNCGQNKME